jgi:branched-chain amino acid aminotransferase
VLKTVYLDGEHVPVESASISVFDSGLNFGDGVFEGIRVYDGKVLFLAEHLRRLYESARAIDLDIPLTREEMAADILRWLAANDISADFHFRPIVTRGIRNPPRVDPRFVVGRPTVLFVGAPIDPAPRTGVRVIFAHVRRAGPDVLDSKIKSISYLGNVLAKLEALRAGVDDALVFDTRGFLAEASVANVFLVRRGKLVTPWPTACLEGVTRDLVLDLGRQAGLVVEERDLTGSDVYGADEVFLSGTGAEITPVVEVNGRPVPGGPVTADLTTRFRAALADHGTPIAG